MFIYVVLSVCALFILCSVPAEPPFPTSRIFRVRYLFPNSIFSWFGVALNQSLPSALPMLQAMFLSLTYCVGPTATLTAEEDYTSYISMLHIWSHHIHIHQGGSEREVWSKPWAWWGILAGTFRPRAINLESVGPVVSQGLRQKK